MLFLMFFFLPCLSLSPSGEPDAQLNPKKKVWENVQPDLRTNEEGVACYKGTPLTVPEKGVFRAPTLRGTAIK